MTVADLAPEWQQQGKPVAGTPVPRATAGGLDAEAIYRLGQEGGLGPADVPRGWRSRGGARSG